MIDEASDECVALAFYGLRKRAKPVTSFYHALLDFFSRLGLGPDKLAVTGTGFSGRPGSFQRIHPRLQRTGISNVEGISIYRMTPGGKIPVSDWEATADLDLREESYFTFGVRKTFLNFEDTLLTEFAHTICEKLQPCYGIGYARAHSLGPVLYAVGLNKYRSPDPSPEIEKERDAEGLRISRWGYNAIPNEVYKKGILRDVYPWNFLTSYQLDGNVEGKRLEEWIKADPSRGTLKEIDERVKLWEVSDNQRQAVFDTLKAENLIFL